MNYTEIKDTALFYADRENDIELPDNIDNFLRIVEARANRAFRVSQQSVRSIIDLTASSADQNIFGLPSDFGGLRDIKYLNGDSETTFNYLSPEQMNLYHSNNFTETKLYYTLLAQQLRIYPSSGQVGSIEILYYQKVPALSLAAANNWLGDDNPDCYIFGLMVEISAFAKNAIAYDLWDKRFKESLEEIETDDSRQRWSGTSLQTRVG